MNIFGRPSTGLAHPSRSGLPGRTDGADPGTPWHFELGQLPATPWKNGAGVTREIAVWPVGAGLDDFDWRLSVAEVAAGGRFSCFPGVDRQIVLVNGPGMRLRAADGSFDVRLNVPGVPFLFAGETEVEASQIDHPSRDFNVMTRRNRCHAHLVAANDTFTVARSEHTVLLLPVSGIWTGETEPLVLRVGEGMLLPRGNGQMYRPKPETPAASRGTAMRPAARCIYVTIETVWT